MGTTFHPDDTKERPFFELLLHYAPEDILKAENIIPNVCELHSRFCNALVVSATLRYVKLIQSCNLSS
jgi:hypothetical protein